jgi:hypothetical protein
MKAKYILLLAAMAFGFVLTGCKEDVPYDTQSSDDQPLILRPYNESGTGSFTYDLANPDMPLYDSVTVTPSRYTTVNWYLDGELIFSGTKINMCFPVGHYALLIEAVTEMGKRTERTGSVTVHPYDTDPYSTTPAGGRHVVPGVEMTMEGQNLTKVKTIVLADDLYGEDEVCRTEPTYQEDGLLTYILPDVVDGEYYLFFLDAEGNLYGSELIQVHNGAVALDGFAEFVPGEEWVITGVSLENVASVKVDETVITDLTVTSTSVTLVAPAAEVGEHTLSMLNKDGSNVLFVTSAGTMAEVKTVVSAETTLWTGPVALAWDADAIKVTSEEMAQVAVGSTIYIYFEVQGDAEYWALRVTTPWWDVNDLVPQIDGANTLPNPYGFEYTDACKNFVDNCGGAMSVVGNGLTITKITYK